MISLIHRLLKTNKTNKNKINEYTKTNTNTENRVVVTREEGGRGHQNGERDQLYTGKYIFRGEHVVGWRRQWRPTPVLLPGKSHGWRSLVGCSPWGL